MKKLFFTILCCFYVVMAYPQYITLKGNQLYDSTGTPYYVKGVNYDVDLHNATFSLAGAVLKPAAYYYHTKRPTYYQDSAGIKDIAADFRFIRDSLGCNTIRLCVANGEALKCTNDSFHVAVRTGNGDAEAWVPTNSLNFMASYYQQLLDTAAACHINIVLLLWGNGAQCDGNSTLQSIYLNYLENTAYYLKNKKALLAYDEWNEPEYCGYQDKGTVCSFSQTWYAALKSYDPNHLVTVGLVGPDVYNYGVDVYAADFYATHIYFNTNKAIHYSSSFGAYVVDSVLDYNLTSAYKDRFNTFAHYMQNVSGRPWMIGEASFGANLYPDYSHPDTANYYKKADGDVTAQAEYLTNLYTVVKQYGGMGCLWWCFMDGRGGHYIYDVDPTDPANNFYGLLSNDRTIKPAGYALRSFSVTTVAGPGPNYPSNYQNLLGKTGTTVTGVVTCSGVGVPNAFITGWHRDSTGSGSWQDNIPGDAEGNFSITSTTPRFGFSNSTTQINIIEVGAAGYNTGTCNASTPANSGNMPAGKHYEITKVANYDKTYTGTHLLANTNYDPLTDPDKLTLTDFYIKAGTGTVYTESVTASNEIAILPQGSTDSYVEQTAEAVFYNSYTPSDCTDPIWASFNADRKSNTNTGNGKPPLKAGTVQQLTNDEIVSNAKTVYLSAQGFLLQVYPNPTNNMVLVQSAKSINFISICNIYGAIVANYNVNEETTQQLNIENLTPGSYMIKILYSDNTTSITQIIKQ